MERNRVHIGDARELALQLEPNSVHMIVTSPPYFNLRDYGTGKWEGGDPACDHQQERKDRAERPRNGLTGGTATVSAQDSGVGYRGTCGKCGAVKVDRQMGQEATPDEFVANLVALFAALRPALRDDGTLWLNLGSSYASGDTAATPSRRVQRESAYGTDGTERPDSQATDSAYPCLCDGCRAVLSSHTTDTHQPHRKSASPWSPTVHDNGHRDSAEASPDASALAAPVSTTTESSPPLPGECLHCDNCGACLSVLNSSSRDVRLCARMSAYNGGTAGILQPLADRRTGKESSSVASAVPSIVQPYYTTFKPKDLIPIPWMVAMALQNDGWYLRSDIVWAKPNPMPESVRDRPTRSHEYLFLFSKSAQYYYDAEAIAEEAQEKPQRRLTPRTFGRAGVPGRADHNGVGILAVEPVNMGKRNKRSVWTVPTQPFSGWAETSRLVPVASGDADDGTTRITSPDCPVHGDRSALPPTAQYDGRGDDATDHTAHNGAGRAPGLIGDSAPTAPHHAPRSVASSWDSPHPLYAPSATAHSNGSHKTDHGPATTLPYMPSVETPDRTERTPSAPASAAPHPGKRESSTSTVATSAHPSPDTASGTADTPSESRSFAASDTSCTCQFYREITEKTSHFATFPPELVRPCIRAGTSEYGACATCGAPWRRVVARTATPAASHKGSAIDRGKTGVNGLGRVQAGERYEAVPTGAWEPSCRCGTTERRPCVVFDPFCGSGTTPMVAVEEGRDWLGFDLDPRSVGWTAARLRALPVRSLFAAGG